MSDLSSILSPEELLLLQLCRLNFTGQHKDEILKLINQVCDWNRFVTLANDHGIIALCWYNLVALHCDATIPGKDLDLLHSGYLKSLSRNTQIFELLKEVLSIAAGEKIKVVLLKGLALESTVYGNKGLRQMNDLDILVRGADAMNLRKTLLKNGFEPIPMISPFHKIMVSYLNHLPAMYKNGLSVEIHFSLFDYEDNALTSELFDTSVPVNLGANNAYVPQPQSHFLYLVKHLAKHEEDGDSQLRLYTDLAVILDLCMDQILNPELLEYSRRANIEDSLCSKLTILTIFLGIEIPLFPGSLQIRNKEEIEYEKFIQFLRHPNGNKPEEKPVGYFKILKNTPGIFNKFLFILGHLLPSLTYMKYRYKTKTIWGAMLYYPVRWIKFGKLIIARIP